MDRIWRSKTTFDPSTKKKPQLLLPNEISNKIIQLQMDIDDDSQINKQTIVQLLQQYTKAIEFFEERNDERYKLYQKKMQKFLQKPAIDTILKGGKSKMAMKKQRTQEQVRKASTQNKVVAKKIIECSQQGIQKQKQHIESQIAQQNEKLEERIQRKRINSERKKVGKLSASFSTSTAKDQEPLLIDFQDLKPTKKKVYL